MLEGASKFIGWIERRLHPRWSWVTGTTTIMRLHGLLVCAGAGLLLLLRDVTRVLYWYQNVRLRRFRRVLGQAEPAQ